MSPRQFALEVVRKLRDAGHLAYWAGGCVRDEQLEREPKDYDVATDAVPERIRQIFGRRRTIAIGAAFGVITVVGPRSAGQIEVATFRQDAEYSDGRHPDSVSFSSPQEDAQRRDFTINGLFYDPVAEQVIDFVDGQKDLAAGIIRAIGDPEARIQEDKLRMLRAVRFAAAFGFEIERRTFEAVRRHASEIQVVSGERIAAEMRRMLSAPTRVVAADLLRQTETLPVILPEAVKILAPDCDEAQPLPAPLWERTLSLLDAIATDDFAQALAALLLGPSRIDQVPPATLIAAIGQRWRLTRREIADVAWFLTEYPLVIDAHRRAWSEVQPTLADARAARLVQFARAVCENEGDDDGGVHLCEQKLALPAEQLAPAPLLTGHDLKAAGIRPGPDFARLLKAVRQAQLDGSIVTREEALAWLRAQ